MTREEADEKYPLREFFDVDDSNKTAKLRDPVGLANYFAERIRTECLMRYRRGFRVSYLDLFRFTLEFKIGEDV